tara:strand:+ start:735 stop:1043 length:309 start_codon:yes stop_codon:yes gene_type:complete
MSNFHKDIENIKKFRSFLDVIITRVEKGEKIDFDAISKLNQTINNYFSSCENERKTSEENKHDQTIVMDTFLSDILENKYKSTKKRNILSEYENYKKYMFTY